MNLHLAGSSLLIVTQLRLHLDSLLQPVSDREGESKLAERVGDDRFRNRLVFAAVRHEVVNQNGEEEIQEDEVADDDEDDEVGHR